MVCVAPNGYIIDVIGPFRATENDACIMQQIFEGMPEVRSKFQNGDVFVVDRGFRDVKTYLEHRGCIVKMPEIIPAGESQLSDLQASRLRLVTKVRFVVEIINGQLKTFFRYFDHVWCIQAIPHLMTEFRNAAAIHNMFYSDITPDKDQLQKIARLMLERLTKPNLLFRLVEVQHLNRKTSTFLSLDTNEWRSFHS